jgi:hypothetical protein
MDRGTAHTPRPRSTRHPRGAASAPLCQMEVQCTSSACQARPPAARRRVAAGCPRPPAAADARLPIRSPRAPARLPHLDIPPV